MTLLGGKAFRFAIATMLAGVGVAAAAACSSSSSPKDEVTTGDGSAGGDGASGGDPTDGPTCSPNVEVDPKNCGRCGHDCRGGSCLGAVCQPVVMAAGMQAPRLLGSDATDLFFAAGEQLRRVSKAGGTEPIAIEVSAPSANVNRGLWSYFDDAFFAAEFDYGSAGAPSTGHRVVRTAKTGGAPSILATVGSGGFDDSGGSVLAVDTSFVYAELGYRLFAIPKPGGAAVFITLGYSLSSRPARAAGDRLYFSDTNDIRRVDIRTDGGAGETVARNTNATDFQIVGADIFYTSTPTGSVRRTVIDPADGGPGTLLAFGQDGPAAIATDATTVYFAASGEDTILSCPLAGCGAEPRIIAKRQFGVSKIIVDDTSVYWAATNGGTIVRVAK